MSVPGQRPIPLGLYDHAPDPSFASISAVKLPEFPGAGVLRGATKAINDAERFLNDLVPFP
ncbi:MAG TPA: hypothetical protein VK486_17310 [Thermoleophilaceae bacterium]|nr:hypothetical protein [Thermoleophilaceae bacterium]